DPHAQWEIQAYGRVMAGILKRVAPLSYEAWIDYDVAGASLSRAELEALQRLLEPTDDRIRVRPEPGSITADELQALGLSTREVRELLDKLRPRERPDFELDLSKMRRPEEFEAQLRDAVPLI